MNKLDIAYFKDKLKNEKKMLENELKKIAAQNPNNPDEWDAVPEQLNNTVADKNEMSDFYEEFGNRQALEGELEKRLKDVNDALERIKNGTYGFCVNNGEPIDEKRLKANPAASTCINHNH